MFYCDDCAEDLDWPHPTLTRSAGPCECCSELSLCNDLPTALLSVPLSDDEPDSLPERVT